MQQNFVAGRVLAGMVLFWPGGCGGVCFTGGAMRAGHSGQLIQLSFNKYGKRLYTGPRIISLRSNCSNSN
jgi:hypothetical protein